MVGLKHRLVPPHLKLNEREKQRVLEIYGSIYKFPKIKASDPAIRHLKAKPGDIIMIKRFDGGVYYRVVVEG